MMRNALPEKHRDVVVTLLASQLIIASCTYRFGYLSVRVKPIERVFAARQRIKYSLVVKLAGHPKIFLITSNCVKIREDFFHASELGVQRALLLLVRKPINSELDPIRHLRHHVKSLLVVAVEIDVQESSHDLVQRVVRRPNALGLVHSIKELFGIRRKITGVKPARWHCLLDFGEFRDHGLRSRLEPLISCA